MKKALASMAIVLTMAATALTGTALTVCAQSTDTVEAAAPSSENPSSSTELSGISSARTTDPALTVLDNDPSEWSDDDEDYSIVRGAPENLELRSLPNEGQGEIIGQLHNGQEVLMTTRWDGDYVLVYSAELNSYGWVNGIYLG